MFVDEGLLPSAVAVRIGNFSAEQPAGGQERRLWVRPSDARALFRRCVEADFDGFHVVYALSCEAAGWVDLSAARDLLAWSPEEYR
jgi:hypothetical protein